MATAAERSPGQVFALVIGAVYLLVGLVGFFVTDDFTGGTADDQLIVFRLNHLHNIVHVALGAAWLVASRTPAAARTVNLALGAVLIVVAVLGFTAIDLVHTLLNITESLDPDNFLHLVTGGLGLYFGTTATAARAPATR